MDSDKKKEVKDAAYTSFILNRAFKLEGGGFEENSTTLTLTLNLHVRFAEYSALCKMHPRWFTNAEKKGTYSETIVVEVPTNGPPPLTRVGIALYLLGVTHIAEMAEGTTLHADVLKVRARLMASAGNAHSGNAFCLLFVGRCVW